MFQWSDAPTLNKDIDVKDVLADKPVMGRHVALLAVRTRALKDVSTCFDELYNTTEKLFNIVVVQYIELYAFLRI